MGKIRNKDVLSRSVASAKVCAQQLEIDFTPKPKPKSRKPKPKKRKPMKKRELTPIEKLKFTTERKCLRCDGRHRSRWPGICKSCKRHVDQNELEEYEVHL